MVGGGGGGGRQFPLTTQRVCVCRGRGRGRRQFPLTTVLVSVCVLKRERETEGERCV